MATVGKRIHLIGIGGTGMSSLAEILLQKGYRVSGSDKKETETTKKLREKGAVVFIGHRKEQVLGAELGVVSSAIPSNNAELTELQKNDIPVISRMDMLNELIKDKKKIGVAGTHGKTTTSALIALMMEKGGLDPTVMIGGKLKGPQENARAGEGEFAVAEMDESDGSFLKVCSDYAVVTNVDNDHLDFYGTMENMENQFKMFCSHVKNEGMVFLNQDDKRSREIEKYLTKIHKPHETYGIEQEADWAAKNICRKNFGNTFALWYQGDFMGDMEIKIPGIHNIYNALAGIGAAYRLGIPLETIKEALKAFEGVKRRFEILYQGEIKKGAPKVVIADDYAHHPTEIRCALKTAKEYHAGKIIAVFQPHRYSRTLQLKDAFSKAFLGADVVLVTDIYGAGERKICGVSGEMIADGIQEAGYAKVFYISNKNDIYPFLLQELSPGDLVMTIGAGSICEISRRLAKTLKEKEEDFCE